MQSAEQLTYKEQMVAERINNYFKSSHMSLYEKIFHASLIAQHELDAHHFGSENERFRITEFKMILDSLLLKINSNT